MTAGFAPQPGVAGTALSLTVAVPYSAMSRVRKQAGIPGLVTGSLTVAARFVRAGSSVLSVYRADVELRLGAVAHRATFAERVCVGQGV